MKAAGFDVVTLAGNHMFDQGPNGVTDTVETLRGLGIATAYELDHASPGGPPTTYTFATPKTLDAMATDIGSARDVADIVIVAFHKGIGHTPAALAMYETAIANAAVDAGAHAVIGHHAHIMRGIEVYRGAPIFHGLGNFVTVTRALSIEDNPSPERQAWARRREELFGFRPDPDMPTYPFHPESRNTAVAAIEADRTGVVRAGFVPCWIDGDARPVPVGGTEHGVRVATYVEDISRRAGFETHFESDDDRVWIDLAT